jgi:L-asparaginase II
VPAAQLVRVVRSGLVESVHGGSVAVCDAEGRLVAHLGDPGHQVFSRSSMKPLQAAVSLRRFAEPGLVPDELLAVMCASHNGEPVHVRTVRRLLRRGDVPESALGCPPDLPMRRADRAQAARPRRVVHNCSGKHAGMLVACSDSGLDLDTYLRPTHPLQRGVARAVRRATGVEPRIGVDGCGAPVHGLPLRAMATLFARLARPERLGVLADPASRAVAAMRAHPYLVAGAGRSDTLIMRGTSNIVCKVGAEGLHCAAILDGGLGVAVKIADGGDRAAGLALVRALELLPAISAEQAERLAPLVHPPVLGGGRPAGAMVADFRLRRRG